MFFVLLSLKAFIIKKLAIDVSIERGIFLFYYM